MAAGRSGNLEETDKESLLLSYFCGNVAELANAPDLKSGVRKDMWDRDLPLSFNILK